MENFTRFELDFIKWGLSVFFIQDNPYKETVSNIIEKIDKEIEKREEF